MSQNPNLTTLDAVQALKRSFDGANDAVRVDIISNLDSSIEINHETDSITSHPKKEAQKVSVSIVSNGVILGPFDVSGMKSINLYAKTTSTITGTKSCILEISPSDTDDVWMSAPLAVTPSATNDAVVSGASISIVARRARVSIADHITDGSFDLYVVAQAV